MKFNVGDRVRVIRGWAKGREGTVVPYAGDVRDDLILVDVDGCSSGLAATPEDIVLVAGDGVRVQGVAHESAWGGGWTIGEVWLDILFHEGDEVRITIEVVRKAGESK